MLMSAMERSYTRQNIRQYWQILVTLELKPRTRTVIVVGVETDVLLVGEVEQVACHNACNKGKHHLPGPVLEIAL